MDGGSLPAGARGAPGRRIRIAAVSSVGGVMRHALFGLTLVACLLLAVAEFQHLNTIHIGTTERAGLKVGSNHSWSLLIVAAAASLLGFGAWSTGARPAALA